jgi:hypothetical protein
MGWLKLAGPSQSPALPYSPGSCAVQEDLKATTTTQHIESIPLPPPIEKPPFPSSTPTPNRKYPHSSPTIPNTHLPFIPASEVRLRKPHPTNPSSSQPNDLWLVIDNIVYDCSTFVAEHPGGEQVLESFRGEDCSWQFWRFHEKQQMEEFGRPLRVGRTAGVVNRFREKPRWVGLTGLGGTDEW